MRWHCVALITLLSSGRVAGQTADSTTTLPLKPTRTARFTTSEGTWMSLDVSPDGKTNVFHLLGDLYTLPISGGKATRITSGMGFDQSPRFSPDGKEIVFVSDRSGGENLWLVHPDGSGLKQLTNTDHYLYISPTWLPDGSGVIASRAISFVDGDLHLYPINGGTGSQLIREGT